MRIALFSECYTPVPNGVVTSITSLRQTLQAWGHTVYVFAPGQPQPDDDEGVFRLPELPFPRHPYHFARPFPRLHCDFEGLNVDIIHCQHPFTVGKLGAETAKKHNIPMIYTAHSRYDAMLATAKSSILRSMAPKPMLSLVRRFCAKADYVITPSRHTRDCLRADKIRARYVVIPSGVTPPKPRTGAREHLRGRLGLKPETPIILYLGRLGPEKRLDLLLHSVAELCRKGLPAPYADFHTVLVGDGQSREELEHLSHELGLQNRVHFTGMVPYPDVGDWYAASDIFALPSPMETQGLVIVEAMSFGLPCVTVNEGGACELIAEGETGYRVPVETHAFAGVLERFLTNPELREQFGEAGRERAQLYTPEAMTRKVLEVYERALQRPRPLQETKVRLINLEIRRLKSERRRGVPRLKSSNFHLWKDD